MKKFLLGMAMLGMCMVALAGCTTISPDEGGNPSKPEEEKTGLELVEEMCEKLPEAKEIVQTIEIRSTDAAIVQYESEKTFTKGTGSYSVTGREKRLNDLDSGKEEAYTETSVSETLSVGNYKTQLDFNGLYFSSTPSFKDGVLTGNVRDSGVERFLGLKEDLPSAPHGMKLRVTTESGHITGIAIDYTASASTVEISLIFSY